MNGGERGGLGSFPVKIIPPSHDALYDSRRRASDPRPDPGAGPPDEAPFVHLHVHSHFSFLDGAARVAELAARAAELGQPALALTDHDGLYGVVRFARACAKVGVRPIFGAEVRVEPLLPGAWLPGRDPDPSLPAGRGAGAGADSASDPAAPPADEGGQVARAGTTTTDPAPSPALASRDHPYHLVLLAETREGYANLCRLVSAAHLAVPERDHPPLVTRDMLAEFREGLVCLTACRQGEVGRLVDAGRDDDARRALLELRDLFGADHLVVELQHYGYEPHREAEAGQGGALVVEKVRGDDGRLRHRASAEQPVAPRDPGRGPGTPRDPGAGRRPRPQAFGVSATGPGATCPRDTPSGSTRPTTTRASTATGGPGRSPAWPTATTCCAWPARPVYRPPSPPTPTTPAPRTATCIWWCGPPGATNRCRATPNRYPALAACARGPSWRPRSLPCWLCTWRAAPPGGTARRGRHRQSRPPAPPLRRSSPSLPWTRRP